MLLSLAEKKSLASTSKKATAPCTKKSEEIGSKKEAMREEEESSPEAEAGEAAVGAAVGRIEADCLLAVAERVGEAAEAGERGGAVPRHAALSGRGPRRGRSAAAPRRACPSCTTRCPGGSHPGGSRCSPTTPPEGRRRSRSVSKKRRGVNAAPRGAMPPPPRMMLPWP